MEDKTTQSKKIIFHHIMPMQIRWNDADVFGHVNNSVYYQFYDTAKTHYIDTVCHGVDWDKCAIVMVHEESDFVRSILATEHIAVRSAVVKIGHKSFTLVQEAFDSVTGTLRCRCRSVMVYINRKDHQPETLPEEWVKYIREYDGDNIEE